MVLDLKNMSVNSKPGSHTQLTYKEKDYWVKEIEMYLTEENHDLESNSFIFDYEEYQRLQFTVDWIPELYEYKIEGKKQIWKYSHIENILHRKKRSYSENVRDFGKYFLGEIVPFILNYRRNDDKYFFHIDPGFGNFVVTETGYCLLEPNNWQWVTEDKFDRIVRYTTQKFVK